MKSKQAEDEMRWIFNDCIKSLEKMSVDINDDAIIVEIVSWFNLKDHQPDGAIEFRN